MQFRLTYVPVGLAIHSSQGLRITVAGSTDLEIVLRARLDQERGVPSTSDDAIVEIRAQRQPTKKAQPVFEAIIAGRRPREGEKARSADDMILRDGPSYGLEYYPDPFAEFVSEVHRSLAEAGKRFINILRWRYAQEGVPLRAGPNSFLFSPDDGQNWHALLPWMLSSRSVTLPSSVLQVERVDTCEVKSLFELGADEPLAQELLREAKAIRFHSARSSVLIAVSAMEVAVKSVVTNKIPDAAWLVEGSQAPPLVDMLSEYFPQLFPVGMPYSANRNEWPICAIRKAVFLRNTLAHRGGSPPTDEKVGEILRLTEEVLWICDYLCGHRWALEYVNTLRRSQ